MLVNEEEASKRLNSPLNLMNRLASLRGRKNKEALSIFMPPKKNNEIKEFPEESVSSNPRISSEGPTLDNILENSDSQIKLGLAHDKSLDLLMSSVNLLAAKLDDVRADKLPSVIASASKVVESIRRERSEAAKNGRDHEVHYHFYTPSQRPIDSYEVIDVQ